MRNWSEDAKRGSWCLDYGCCPEGQEAYAEKEASVPSKFKMPEEKLELVPVRLYFQASARVGV